MSVVTISPSNQNIQISSIDQQNTLSISSYNSTSVGISGIIPYINTNIINTIDSNNINISPSNFNNITISTSQPINNPEVYPHQHPSSDITDFNSSVSGLLPVKNIVGSGNINVVSNLGNFTISLNNNISSSINYVNYGRLSLVSNDPTNSNSSSNTIYFTPYLGNQISIYNTLAQEWITYEFIETSLLLGTMIPNTNYDIFCFYNGNNIVLEKISWLSNTNRNIQLSYINGFPVKSSDYSRKYLGTIRSTSSTTIEDISSRRFVYNYYNQIPKILNASDNVTHTYTSAIIRLYRNISTLGLTKVEFINGIDNQILNLICQSRFIVESSSSTVGLSIDSNTTFNTKANNTNIFSFGGSPITTDSFSFDIIKPSQGYHFLQLLQSGSNVTTFYNASLKTSILC